MPTLNLKCVYNVLISYILISTRVISHCLRVETVCHWPNAASMLFRNLQHQANIHTALGQHHVVLGAKLYILCNAKAWAVVSSELLLFVIGHKTETNSSNC